MNEIRLFDTLTGSVRELAPRDPGRVSIYACGPTVYAPIHVGNARPFVVFSLLKRFLERRGYAATLVVNVTDVNDKIYAAAAQAGVPSERLAREMSDRYVADTDRLGLGRPDAEPRASETIGPIVALIETLIDAGHAYAADGDVYFSVASFGGYGRLSNRSPADMDQGEGDRGETATRKRDARDFALWKAHKPGEDTAWEAPWGRGRPGWHIECSAMAEQILGVDFDIHGGGVDLVFPHHENEIAQTEAARSRRLARLWMHNGMVRFDSEKMSKSEGNIRLLSEALDEFGRDALVMYFVRGHFRQPLDFSADALAQARSAVSRIRDFGRRLDESAPPLAFAGELSARFFGRLADDFDTPGALAAVFDLVKEGNARLDAGERFSAGDELPAMLHCLGLEGLLDGADGATDPRARELLERRAQARGERDFAAADAIREQLKGLGYEVRDTPAGQRLVPIE